MQTTFILGFLWANVEFILGKQLYYLYLSVAMLSLDNTVRFEGWIFSVFLSPSYFSFRGNNIYDCTALLAHLWRCGYFHSRGSLATILKGAIRYTS